MTTHIAYKEQPSVKYIATEFLSEIFSYDKTTNSYSCTAGAILASLGIWHNKKDKPMKPVTVLKRIEQMHVKPER